MDERPADDQEIAADAAETAEAEDSGTQIIHLADQPGLSETLAEVQSNSNFHRETLLYLGYVLLAFPMVALLAMRSVTLRLLLGAFFAPRHDPIGSDSEALGYYAQGMGQEFWLWFGGAVLIALLLLLAKRMPRAQQLTARVNPTLGMLFFVLIFGARIGLEFFVHFNEDFHFRADFASWLAILLLITGLLWMGRLATLGVDPGKPSE